MNIFRKNGLDFGWKSFLHGYIFFFKYLDEYIVDRQDFYSF